MNKQEVERPFYKLYCWQALQKWGEEFQLDRVVEELLELALAVQDYKRGRPKARESVVEEMVDVSLILGQLREILLIKGSEIEKVRKEKLVRLMTKLDMEVISNDCPRSSNMGKKSL
ncbi:unnamed protein product [marine sediment metagenome]|uniref:NTP pyrophosphohydrolase MazG putative catalytic core domain-containing protein n=1 Tax=marine sediment metagenome TaxID=412755 RepID=X1J307_9ZZZZ